MRGLSLIRYLYLPLVPLGLLSFSSGSDSKHTNTVKHSSVLDEEPSCTTAHWVPGTNIEWNKPDDKQIEEYKKSDACKIKISTSISVNGASMTTTEYQTKKGKVKVRIKKVNKQKETKEAKETLNQALQADPSLSSIGDLLPMLGDENTLKLAQLVKDDPQLLKEISDSSISKADIFNKLEEKGLNLSAISQSIANDTSGQFDEWQNALDLSQYSSNLYQYQSVSDILAIRPDNYNQTQKTVYSTTAGISFVLFVSMIYGLKKVSGMSAISLWRKKQYFLFVLGLGLLLSSGMGGYMIYNLMNLI